MGKKLAEVHKKVEIRPDAELWHGSMILLKKATANQQGSNYLIMASIIFAAFSIEAYLTHLGKKIYMEEDWVEFEKKSPLDKLDILSEKYSVKLNKGTRPYQTIKAVFDFRNTLAHGKTIPLSKREDKLVDDKLDQYIGEWLRAEWQKYCTLENAKRAREDIEKVANQIFEKCRLLECDKISHDFPFHFGFQTGSATLKDK